MILRNLLRLDIFLLVLILLVALFARLYKIDISIAEHHSWRQADTAAVARNFVKEGFDLLHPKIDNMATQSGPKLPINEERLFLTEFPLYNATIGVAYTLFGVADKNARLVTVFFSLGTIVFLFLLLRNIWASLEGLLAAFFYAVIPYSVFYSRVVLPEPAMVFFTVGATYFIVKWQNADRKLYWLLLSAVFFALALLTKIYIIFALPAFLYLLWRNIGVKTIRKKEAWIFLAIAVTPIALWRLYISQTPEGIPGNSWLFNANNIRFTGAFFRWIIFERFDKLMLTVGGMFLLLVGLILRVDQKVGLFFHVWLVGLLVYTLVFATGNVTHDYYQIIFLPIFVIFMARGAGFLLRGGLHVTSYIMSLTVVGSAVFTMLALGWYEVRGFYNIQSGVDLAGAYIHENAPKDATVITGITADTTLLYNTNRHGWTIGYGTPYDGDGKSIELLRVKGADYYVTTRMEDFDATNNVLTNYLKVNYLLEKKTDQFAVFNLNKQTK